MKLKKITALCLTLTMIISSGVYTVFAEEETTEITGEVEFANDKLTSLDASITSGLAERLTEVSGINVEIMNYPDVASYQTYIQQSIRTEDAPGLITWWGDQQFVTLAENGLLEDLTDLWNDYLLPSLILPQEKGTIPMVIQNLKGGYGSIDMGAMMAMLVLAIVPIIIFYLSCQKYIIKGVAAGAVKG